MTVTGWAGLTAAVYGLLCWRVFPRLPQGRKTAGLVLAWIGLVGALSALGVLEAEMGQRPPRLMIVMAPAFGFLFYLALSKRVPKAIAKLSLVDLTWIQSFRIGVELLLWRLAEARLLPVEMSFEGRNFDVLVGLSAPLVAWFYSSGRLGKAGLRAWNWASVLMLTNVVVHGMLSTPGVEILKLDPPNYIVTQYPAAWLPAFLVMTAYALHILSLRKLAKR